MSRGIIREKFFLLQKSHGFSIEKCSKKIIKSPLSHGTHLIIVVSKRALMNSLSSLSSSSVTSSSIDEFLSKLSYSTIIFFTVSNSKISSLRVNSLKNLCYKFVKIMHRILRFRCMIFLNIWRVVVTLHVHADIVLEICVISFKEFMN